MRPAAGALGLVAHPARGAWKSMQKQWAREQTQFQRQTRLSDGAREVHQTGKVNHQGIVKKFQDLQLTTKERQTKYKDLAEREMYGDEDTSTAGSSTAAATDGTTSQTAASPVASSVSPDSPATEPPTAHNEEEEEAAFQRDLELAKRLSEAEHQGYLRGLSSSAQNQ